MIMALPEIGSTWKSKQNGQLYIVRFKGFNPQNADDMIVYQELNQAEGSLVYCLSSRKWDEYFTLQ
jgi:hypothetical protein